MELPSPPTPGFRPTSWSSDGRRLAGVYRDTEGRRLQPGWYDFDTHTYTALDAPCGSIQWLPDATTLLCVSGRNLFSVNPDTGNLDLVRSFPYEADTRFDVSPDGEWVYVVLREHLPEIWIATPDVAPGN